MKKLIPYGVILLLLGIVIYLWTKPKEVQYMGSNEKESPPLVNQFKDSAGRNHSTYDVTNSTVSQNDVRNPKIPLGIVDTSAALLKIARTQLQQVTQLATRRQDSILQGKREINALKQRIIRYQDANLDIAYTPDPDTSKAGTFAFSYNQNVTVSQYQKRNKVLGLPIGAKKSYIDVVSNDPRAMINGLKSLTIEQSAPSFGLRVQGSGNYNPQTGAYGFGPAVRIDVGRFSFQGNYTYYPESTRWRPSINANFDLVRF